MHALSSPCLHVSKLAASRPASWSSSVELQDGPHNNEQGPRSAECSNVSLSLSALQQVLSNIISSEASETLSISVRMQLFCLQLEASCLQWSFSTCSWQFWLFCSQLELFCLLLSLFFTYDWSFFCLERGFPDWFWKQIGTNRKKTEQIGTNRGIPENKERKSEQIGRKRGNRNKSEWPCSADPKSGALIYDHVINFHDPTGLAKSTRTPETWQSEKNTQKIQNPTPTVGSQRYDLKSSKVFFLIPRAPVNVSHRFRGCMGLGIR